MQKQDVLVFTEMNRFQANLSVSFLSIISPSEDSPSQDLPDYELLSKARFSLGTDLVELAPLKTLSLQIQKASQNSHISLNCPLLRSATWLDCFGFPLTHLHLVSLQHAADVLLLSDPCKFLFALLNLQQEDD